MKKEGVSIVECEDCNWKKIVKGKWILLDANAVINIIKYDPDSFLEIIKDLEVTLFTLQPIILELNRTNDRTERMKRNIFLNNVEKIGLDQGLIQKSEEIQEKMWLDDYYPESEDLYLASAIKKYSNGKTFLATSNLSDFREPLFEKKGFILLKNEKSVCTISLLIFRQEELLGEKVSF